MIVNTFAFSFRTGNALDIGRTRQSNQDRVICCPELGFFAVSDGMGGLPSGGETSAIIAETLPGAIHGVFEETRGRKITPKKYGALLAERVKMISDQVYDTGNGAKRITFGATLTCVLLIDSFAVFVNLGDSRGFLLSRYQRTLLQITEDHNIAGELVALGELTRDEARYHPTSSILTRFIGMPVPAQPEFFVEKIAPGDRILLCSDGLYSMLTYGQMRRIMRSSQSPETVCARLVDAANEAGGHDNISAVYLKIGAGALERTRRRSVCDG